MATRWKELTDDEVKQLRDLAASGQYTREELGAKFFMSPVYVGRIVAGRLRVRAPGPVFPGGIVRARQMAKEARLVEEAKRLRDLGGETTQKAKRRPEKQRARTPAQKKRREAKLAKLREMALARVPGLRESFADAEGVSEGVEGVADTPKKDE